MRPLQTGDVDLLHAIRARATRPDTFGSGSLINSNQRRRNDLPGEAVTVVEPPAHVGFATSACDSHETKGEIARPVDRGHLRPTVRRSWAFMGVVGADRRESTWASNGQNRAVCSAGVAGGRAPAIEIVGGANQRQAGKGLREVLSSVRPTACDPPSRPTRRDGWRDRHSRLHRGLRKRFSHRSARKARSV